MRAEEWDKKVEGGQGPPECQTGDTKEKDDSTNRCAKYLNLQKKMYLEYYEWEGIWSYARNKFN